MAPNLLDLAVYVMATLSLLADGISMTGWVRVALMLKVAVWVAQGVALLM